MAMRYKIRAWSIDGLDMRGRRKRGQGARWAKLPSSEPVPELGMGVGVGVGVGVWNCGRGLATLHVIKQFA